MKMYENKLYDKENKRLIYVKEIASPDFWDRRWSVADFSGSVERARNSRFILGIIRKYVSNKEDLILEGGCGNGQNVYCMDYHGYKVIGLDYAEETIYKIKKSYPQLEVEIGNVMNLPFRDNSFNGYFSLGLIEHFWEGYHDIVQEMRRVLAKGGYLFLTFPYMSLLRRLKANINLFEQYKKEYGEMADFFQFALNKEQVVEVFREEGFRLVDSKPKYGLRGVMDEISWFNNRLTQKCYRYTGRNILIKGPMLVLDKLLTPFAGHVMLMVFQKE